MSSFKAVLISDYFGNNLFSYLGSNFKTDPGLITGMFNALGNFSREVFGGGLSSFVCDNGLKVLFDKFFVKHSVVNKYLKLDAGFRFTEPLVKISDFDFYLASSVPDNFVGKRFIFDDFFSKLDSKPGKFSVFDYESKALIYSIDYKPGIRYELSDVPTNLGVGYCLIFDSVDESLDDGSFVRSNFASLGSLIKSNVNVFGPALLWGDVGLVDSIIGPLIFDFVKSYDSTRFTLFGNKLVSDLSMPVFDDVKKKEVRAGIESVLKAINGSAKYLPKSKDNC